MKNLLSSYSVWPLFFLALSVVTAGPSLSSQQAHLMKHAIKSLLGFQKVPGEHEPVSDTTILDQPAPQYMLQLYERYKNGAIESGHSKANTVRSIQPNIGLVNKERMFIFNLTSITASEKVLSSQLHLYKHKVKRTQRPDGFHLQLYQLSPSSLRELGSRVLAGRSHGWQATEISGSLKACLQQESAGKHSLLAVRVVRRDRDGSLDAVNVSTIARHVSRPFLVVFSNEAQNISVDHIDPHLKTGREHGQFVDPESGQPTSLIEKDVKWTMKDRTEPGTEDSKIPTKLDRGQDGRLKTTRGSRTRERRSIHDNKIPQVADGYDQEDLAMKLNIPLTHPAMLQGRRHFRYTVSDRKSRYGMDTDKPHSRRIPYPHQYNQAKRRQKKRRRDKRRRHRQEDLLPVAEWPELNTAHSHKDKLCGKRRLVVDFADIGWSQWIISPKSFEASYCAGQCPFPLAQRLHPSNHATIQSLVNAIGIKTDVPAPCCVPDTMSSITLLYFDTDHNVVLKNYPGMSVTTCACR